VLFNQQLSSSNRIRISDHRRYEERRVSYGTAPVLGDLGQRSACAPGR